jgi:hypothetical protein
MSDLPLFNNDVNAAALSPTGENLPPLPSTPIAAELHAHFAEGGSISTAIKLVASLERAQSRPVRPSSRASLVAGCRLIGNGRFPSIVAFRASGK